MSPINSMTGWETYDPNPPDGGFPWREGLLSILFVVALIWFIV
jgi:hypothetical protein